MIPRKYDGGLHHAELNASLRKDEHFASEYNFSVCLSVIGHSVSWQNLRKIKKNPMVLNGRNYAGPNCVLSAPGIRKDTL